MFESTARPLPSAAHPPGERGALRPAPSRARCLRCQLLGRRRLTCAKAELCLELPHVFPLGPVLLLGWLATAAAFVAAVW
jgi:hypothetical protein